MFGKVPEDSDAITEDEEFGYGESVGGSGGSDETGIARTSVVESAMITVRSGLLVLFCRGGGIVTADTVFIALF